jgi:iron complex transport system ATP-binding protein
MGVVERQTLGTRSMNTVLHTKALTVGYRKKPVLQDITLELKEGELVSLIGLNGSGKSTLLRTLAGLQHPLSGEIHIGEDQLTKMSSAERARNISVVLTGRPSIGLLDVHTLIALGRQPWTDHLGRLSEKDLKKVDLAMEHTGTSTFAKRSISELSDGELQKVLIARALAQDTPLMLLDEPTAFLDLVNRVQVMRLLRDIVHALKKTVLLSTHDLRTALKLSDRLLIVDQGKLWSGTPDEAVGQGALEKAFSNERPRFDPATMSFV